MTFGINNIFTIFWFIIMLGCGGTLTYISFTKDIFTSDLIIVAKVFLGLIIVITIAVVIFLLINIRLLIISTNGIVSIKPFIFQKKQVLWDNIKGIKWTKWEIKTTVYKSIEIKTDDKTIIKFSDFEFENFDKLVQRIPGQNSEQKSKIYFDQAKTNLPSMNFLIVLSGLLILLILWLNIFRNDYHWIHLIFYGALTTLMYAAISRRKKYRLTTKPR